MPIPILIWEDTMIDNTAHISFLYQNYTAALRTLSEDLHKGELSRLEMGGVCKQFELVVKLGWNLWKEYLVNQGIAPKFKNPRLTIQACRDNGLFEAAGVDGAVFAKLFEDRIQLSDLYDFQDFLHIGAALKQSYLRELQVTQEFFTQFLEGKNLARDILPQADNNIDSLRMIQSLSEAFGPPGFEDDVVEAARRSIPSGYKTDRDSLLNLYIKGEAKDGPTVLVEAHTDELGLMVRGVRSNGTLAVAALGSWAHCALPAQRMRIKNNDGNIVIGIVAAKPPHLAAGASAGAPDVEELSVDIGASSADEVYEVYNIGPGCPMVPDAPFEKHHNGIIMGKAFDCRLGCAAVLDVLARAHNPGIRLVGALASQEEVGARGAQVVAERLRPDAVICFEGSPADDTFAEPHLAAQVSLRKGPMLRHMDRGTITNPRFLRHALFIARDEGLPHQEAVRSTSFTNAQAYQRLGIPTIVISCPVRYIHSHHAIATTQDYFNTISLATAIVQSLSNEIISSF